MSLQVSTASCCASLVLRGLRTWASRLAACGHAVSAETGGTRDSAAHGHGSLTALTLRPWLGSGGRANAPAPARRAVSGLRRLAAAVDAAAKPSGGGACAMPQAQPRRRRLRHRCSGSRGSGTAGFATVCAGSAFAISNRAATPATATAPSAANTAEGVFLRAGAARAAMAMAMAATMPQARSATSRSRRIPGRTARDAGSVTVEAKSSPEGAGREPPRDCGGACAAGLEVLRLAGMPVMRAAEDGLVR